MRRPRFDCRETIDSGNYGAFGSSIDVLDLDDVGVDSELVVDVSRELGTVTPLCPSFVRRQPINSGASSVMFIPSDTMNLQLRMGRGESSSDS